ncbi:MAG: helix-hairpin-helix domain-containing protein [Thermoguttaceae bacterium]
MKARGRKKGDVRDGEFTELEQLPNIGPAIAGYLRSLGVLSPRHLKGRDPYQMYDELGRITGHRYDPCLLDTFIAAVRFLDGEPARPWWKYTAERKRVLKARGKTSGA